MILRMRTLSTSVMRPRVTPHPEHAAELQRRMESIDYHPENGFHRDRSQDRLPPPKLRLVP